MAQTTPIQSYLLRLGDSALILSQRLSELSGHAPVLEEELSTANVALDLLGHAQLWLGEAAKRGAPGKDANELAFYRTEGQFHNLLIVEQPNGDYAHTMVRQYLFDAAHELELAALTQSADETIAAIASKAIREVRYHHERSAEWVVRLGDGTPESHQRTQNALDALWMYGAEVFTPTSGEIELAGEGIVPCLETLLDTWRARVAAVCNEATLILPKDAWTQTGGKAGTHTEHFGFLLAEMQHLPRSYPGASW
jgi:ring-1,2-phenylacetyl-CoA epoxidase subunit PaaC